MVAQVERLDSCNKQVFIIFLPKNSLPRAKVKAKAVSGSNLKFRPIKQQPDLQKTILITSDFLMLWEVKNDNFLISVCRGIS